MPRESFQQELDRLLEEVMDLGGEVQGSLEIMVQAMENRDARMARQETGVDIRYKEWGAEIDERCMILQVLQAPVARDLRLIYSMQSVTNHLVRAGTLCEHICRAIVDTAECERDEDLEIVLLEMARAARDLFGQGLNIFEAREVDRAQDLEAIDDEVDLLYSEAMNLMANPGKEKVGSPEWRARAVLTVHYLERIADHGVSIGERTVFLVTGERIESTMHRYPRRKPNQD